MYVYQFTEAGYRAYRAVEDVLGASVSDHGRAVMEERLIPTLLTDLR